MQRRRVSAQHAALAESAFRAWWGGAREQTQSTLPMIDRRECARAAFAVRPARAHDAYDAGGGGVESAHRTHSAHVFRVLPLDCTGNVLLDGAVTLTKVVRVSFLCA